MKFVNILGKNIFVLGMQILNIIACIYFNPWPGAIPVEKMVNHDYLSKYQHILHQDISFWNQINASQKFIEEWTVLHTHRIYYDLYNLGVLLLTGSKSTDLNPQYELNKVHLFFLVLIYNFLTDYHYNQCKTFFWRLNLLWLSWDHKILKIKNNRPTLQKKSNYT